MSGQVRTVELGGATVSIVNIGDVQSTLASAMDPPQGGWPAGQAALVTKLERYATNCVHIRLPELSLLVDASVYDTPPGAPMAIPGYEPPADLYSALESSGVSVDSVRHVVITHSHADHINGTIRRQGERSVPAFPNARYYLGRADWDLPQMQQALRDPASLQSRTLGMLHGARLLELVDSDDGTPGARELGSGAQILPAPGETPGHQIVRIHSQGQTMYCVGDLYHHPLEAEQPELMMRWAAREEMLSSRLALMERALAENALIVATHIHGLGRLRRAGSGIAWETL